MLGSSQMRLPASGCITSPHEGEKRSLNSELWHACAGPLVSLPALGTRIVYFPQGHSEQVAASTQKEVDAHIPNYPNLPPQLICQLHNVTLHADIETDEVYAQMTLQPVNAQEKEPYLVPDLATQSRQPNTFFCKTLTASDTSTHGGFSIPRRAAEKVFPPLDFTQQPPAQELIARDLHDNEWKFRHIYRGQPKRHLLTTGWSVFVSAKRLTAGDSVLFIRNEKGQLLLGIRRANRPQTVMPSSVLSSDSMHIGVLAAAAHAAATNSRFTIFYNPRASPSEFVIPLTKYEKAVCHTQVSVGMRFRMLFETEESSVRRYMGTITGIGDLDPVRWPNSRWRSIKVGWDESTTGERQRRVSLWEIEPLTTFLVYPPSSNWRLKRPWPQALGTTSPSGLEVENMKRSFMWMSGQNGDRSFHGLVPQGMGVNSWAQMQQRFDSPVQTELYDAIAAAALQETRNNDPLKQLPHVQQQQPLQPQQILFKAQSQIQQQSQHLFLHQQGQPSYSQPLPLQQPHHIQHPKQNCIFQQQTQHSLQQSQQSLLQQQQPHSSHPEQLQQQQQLFQQQPFQVPAVPAAMTRFPSLQPQISPNLSVSTHPQSNTTKPNPGLAAGRQNSFLLQNIFGSLASDDSSLHSNLMPSQTGIQQQSGIIPVSAVHQDPNLSSSWFPSSIGANPLSSGLPSELNDTTRPTGGSCILSQMDPSVLSTLSVPSLPTSAFAVRDSHQERESVNPDPHSHLLFGVNIDAPSLVISSSMSPASRSFNNGNELQSPFVGPLMQASSIGGTDLPLSSSMLVNGSLNECGFLQQVHALTNVNHPTRTFTKVYKLGSVGRSLDVTRFNNYAELRHELARMFGLEGQLEDPQRSGWQLVYTDKESELLLVGDDPWEEFISSVRCIKILSPPEVLQMTQDGMELLSCIPAQRQTSSSSEDCPTRQSRNPSSALTSACSIDY